MNKNIIAIILDRDIIEHLDQLVKKHIFVNCSRAIQKSVKEKLERIERIRLIKECSNLDPKFEKSMAEEGLLEYNKKMLNKKRGFEK